MDLIGPVLAAVGFAVVAVGWIFLVGVLTKLSNNRDAGRFEAGICTIATVAVTLAFPALVGLILYYS